MLDRKNLEFASCECYKATTVLVALPSAVLRTPEEALNSLRAASEWRREWESVACDFAKPNVYNGFALISRNRNDLAFASLRRRLRPCASLCRFCQRDGTRNGTRQSGVSRRAHDAHGI